MSTKQMLLGVMWLIVAACGIYWIYGIITEQQALDEIQKENTKQMNMVIENELKDCAESPTYREMYPASCIGWEKYA